MLLLCLLSLINGSMRFMRDVTSIIYLHFWVASECMNIRQLLDFDKFIHVTNKHVGSFEFLAIIGGKRGAF